MFFWGPDYRFVDVIYANVLEGVIKIEGKIRKYYMDSFGESKSLILEKNYPVFKI